MISGIRHVHALVRAHRDAFRHADPRGGGRAAVPTKRSRAGPGDGSQIPIRGDPAHPSVRHISDVQRTIRTEGEPYRVTKIDRRRQPTLAIEGTPTAATINAM